MVSAGLVLSVVPLLLGITLAVPAAASVMVPIPEATLANHAAAIVVGRVLRIRSHWDFKA